MLKLSDIMYTDTDHFQRVALLEAWKAFEQANGTETDVAKVQGMMPIVGRKQHVDKETGQVVEGMVSHCPCHFRAHFLCRLGTCIRR